MQNAPHKKIALKIVLGAVRFFTIPVRLYGHNKRTKRILLIQLHLIGDVVFITALIRAIRNLLPDHPVDVWINEKCFGIIQHNRAVRQIFQDPCPWTRRNSLLLFIRKMVCNARSIKTMLTQNYDMVFDCSGYLDSALITLLIARKESVGILRGTMYAAAYTKGVRADVSAFPLKVNYLKLLESATGLTVDYTTPYEITLADSDKQWAAEVVGSDTSKHIVVVAPFAGWANKEWPLESFVLLIKQLAAVKNIACIILGAGDKCSTLTERINTIGGVKNYCNKTTLLQSAAIIQRSTVFFGLDSAMAKIAEAFEIPSVLIYGGSNPEISAPVNDPRFTILYNRLECSAGDGTEFCGNGSLSYICKNDFNCMRAISVETVLREIHRYLDRKEFHEAI